MRGAVSCRVHAASCTTRPRHATPTEVRKRKEKIEAQGRRAIHSFHFTHPERESVSSNGKVDMTSLRRPLLFETLDPLPFVVLGPSVVFRRDETNPTIMGLAQSGNDIPIFCTLFHIPTQRSAPLSPFPLRTGVIFFWGGEGGKGPGTRGAKGGEALSAK